jgi:hypothetical protein
MNLHTAELNFIAHRFARFVRQSYKTINYVSLMEAPTIFLSEELS